MKPRIPLAYAGLLVIALVAVVGFAAFSPSGGSADESSAETSITVDTSAQASARVASAVLALRVSDAENRTATTQVADAQEEDVTTTLSETSTTTVATTVAETTATTTEAPVVETVDTTPAPKADTTPPPLKVTSPDDGDTVTDRLVLFTGTSEPGASVRSGPYPADVDDDGSWSLLLTMSEGLNGAKITATDAAGNTSSLRLVVTYDPPNATTQPPTTTTTQPSSTPTTTAPSTPKWSPLWPADAGGIRDVEAWRPLVSQYWPAELVECALNVIYLESRGDPRAYNSGVSAEGLFQHLSKYWKGRAGASGFRDSNGLYATPYNAEANIAAAWHIAKNASPWYAPWSVNPFFGDCES